MTQKLLWISMILVALACSDMGSDVPYGPNIYNGGGIILSGVLVGDTTKLNLSFINSGNANLLVWDFYIGGEDSIDFYLDSLENDTITILPDSIETLFIYHSSSSPGSKSAFIQFSSNVVDKGIISYPLTAHVNVFPTSYASNVQPIFDTNCSGCHGSSGELNLSSYDNLMLGNSTNGPVIIPGNSAGSYLIRKLNGVNITGSPMPLGGSITSEQISSIATWIDEGAENN
ncbi:MAG: cytochrome c [Candidatus Marinimicrobia bacterium]|nr:cytochrome c [Candidatus Neomarinimicrobiota bacterium]